MQQAVKEPEDIGMVREFFASLSRSERLRMYDFFKSRIKFEEKPGQRLSARVGGNDGRRPIKNTVEKPARSQAIEA
jgi:hypothetical protein